MNFPLNRKGAHQPARATGAAGAHGARQGPEAAQHSGDADQTRRGKARAQRATTAQRGPGANPHPPAQFFRIGGASPTGAGGPAGGRGRAAGRQSRRHRRRDRSSGHTQSKAQGEARADANAQSRSPRPRHQAERPRRGLGRRTGGDAARVSEQRAPDSRTPEPPEAQPPADQQGGAGPGAQAAGTKAAPGAGRATPAAKRRELLISFDFRSIVRAYLALLVHNPPLICR